MSEGHVWCMLMATPGPALLLTQRWTHTRRFFFTLFAKPEESDDCPEDGMKTWFGYFPSKAINPKPNVFQPTCSSVFNANIQTHHMFLQCCVWNLNEFFRWFVLIQLLPGLIVPLCIFMSVHQMLVLTKPSLGGRSDVMTITSASISALFVMC